MTTADDKQDQLQKEIQEVQNRLLQLSRGWVVDPDTNVDREKRIAAGQQGRRLADCPTRSWSTTASTPCRNRCACADGDELQLADCAEIAEPAATATRCPGSCASFLHEWATIGGAQALGGVLQQRTRRAARGSTRTT